MISLADLLLAPPFAAIPASPPPPPSPPPSVYSDPWKSVFTQSVSPALAVFGSTFADPGKAEVSQ